MNEYLLLHIKAKPGFENVVVLLPYCQLEPLLRFRLALVGCHRMEETTLHNISLARESPEYGKVRFKSQRVPNNPVQDYKVLYASCRVAPYDAGNRKYM